MGKLWLIVCAKEERKEGVDRINVQLGKESNKMVNGVILAWAETEQEALYTAGYNDNYVYYHAIPVTCIRG